MLDVSEAGLAVTFALDLVLTPEHPEYPPIPGEQYCFRRARLTVASPKRSQLHRSDAPPGTDASGERDFGNIDVFMAVDWDGENALEMSGGWGDLPTVEPDVSIAFE
jgi:hypothetical protein